MLKIKDCLLNKDAIKYIKPDYFQSLHKPNVIYVQFKDDDYLNIHFDSQEERDKEFNKVLKKVEKE